MHPTLLLLVAFFTAVLAMNLPSTIKRRITFSNFPCDDLPNGKGSMTFKLGSDADLSKLLSAIDAIAVKESVNGNGDCLDTLDELKEGVPYFLIFKKRFDTAIGRMENGIKNAATAFEHKANLALMDELTRMGRTEVVLAFEGAFITRANGEAATEIDGLVFAVAPTVAAAAPNDAYVVEAKMYAKVDDLAAVEKKLRFLTDLPAGTSHPINLGGRALTGVLATIDTTPDVIAAAKSMGVWVLVQNGLGFDLITHA